MPLSENLTRRSLLTGVAASAGAALLADASPVNAAPSPAKTPALTAEEMTAMETALGKKGRYVDAESVYTIPLPRADLSVSIKGNRVPIAFGFGGWVSVKHTLDGKSAMLMSDTVLLQEEVNPLIDAAHKAGLEIGAIHNHFFYEEPRIVYMHVHGMGTVPDLAKKYADAIRETKLFPANQLAAAAPPKLADAIFDLPALDAIVGAKGAVNGATYKYTLGRSDLSVVSMGTELTAAIGLNTWASFAGTPDDAHIAGDVAMRESEINPVIRALRANGLEVVAVHHHTLGENPRILFLHYYGRGPALTLAKGFRAALNELGVRR